MRLSPQIEIFSCTHGKELFAREVHRLFSEQKFDCVAVDISCQFQEYLGEAVDNLPVISALLAHNNEERWYYLPIDPCDPMIEAVRQARQNRIPFFCVGMPELHPPKQLFSMPDEYSIKKLGLDLYTTLCRKAAGKTDVNSIEFVNGHHIASNLQTLRLSYSNILAVTHLTNFDSVVHHFSREESYNSEALSSHDDYTVISKPVNPDHLYFALGELPFITGKVELERHDVFASQSDLTEMIKNLFRETRDNYFDDKEQIIKISPVRIQSALTYLRNLTVSSGKLLPSLFDIVEAAKGVGGNAYGLRILKGAKYYPFLPIESGESAVNIGIDKISLIEDMFSGSEREVHKAVNLFRDIEVQWRTLEIKPDPSMLQKKKYRYSWNPFGQCSHLPEDTAIESFNSHVRNKALRVVTEHLAKSEKFTSSVKDGIDIRETLRNWYTGSIYVKELPSQKDRVDTVIIIFDRNNDERYPQRTTWYAEHKEESTLSFYATDPFDDLIGPGIARCIYGGISLLFPPRTIPNIFDLTGKMEHLDCAGRLTYGALMFSAEKTVAYVSAKAPDLKMRTMASQFKKHLVWIPLSTFSTETLNRLRRFHVLNGKEVRSWAARFIGD